MSLLPALREQRQEEVCEFRVTLVHKMNSRAARSTQ